jgi:DHA1 family bicyclomycin/chloramphenicol resistance-like MFS transporter
MQSNVILGKSWAGNRLLVVSISLMLMLSGTEVDLIIPSFPELQNIFNISTSMVQLTLSVNFLAFCVGCIFAGALGDRYSRRTVILTGLIVLFLSSILCAVADNFYLLLVGRVLQGLAIAPISVLTLVVVSDEFPKEQQRSLLGILNGFTNFAMSIAPIIGSYICLYFGWRGNFFFLALFSLICLLLGYIALASRPGDPNIALSPKAYLPLIKSSKFALFYTTIAASFVPFWVFISLSPILYMKDLNVKLEHFGFYQGAICGSFALLSLISPTLLNKLGAKRCFNFGLIACILGLLLIIYASVANIKNPLFLTLTMIIYTLGTIFPINIIYPSALTVINNAKGKASAFILSVKWVFISVALWGAGALYNHSFTAIGIVCIISIIIFLVSLWILKNNEWIEMDAP